MTQAVYILKETGRNLWRHPWTALGSMMSLTLLFLLFDLFWIAAGTSERFYTRLLSDLQLEVFLSDEMSDSTVTAMNPSLVAIEGVRSVEFVSKEEARKCLADLLGVDILAEYDTANPLPRSYMLSLEDDYLSTSEVSRIESELLNMPGIDQVSYGKRWLSKAENTRAAIFNFGAALGLLILLTALINSANNIRLMTKARAVGFRQMRILGAGRLFLALPFLLEGLLIGGLSALAGWVVIIFSRQEITFTRFEIVLPAQQEIAMFTAAAAILGLISGYLGIRKMLR